MLFIHCGQIGRVRLSKKLSELNRICLALILLTSCYSIEIKKGDIIKTFPNPSVRFESFQQLLDSQNIDVEVLKTAQQTLNKLPNEKQNTALDFLTQQVQQFGSIEAKQIFELNPELKLSEVISATSSEKLPEWLSQEFSHNPLLSLEEFKALDARQQLELLTFVEAAISHYEELSVTMRSGVNFATKNRGNLLHFEKQARPITKKTRTNSDRRMGLKSVNPWLKNGVQRQPIFHRFILSLL